MTTLHEHGTGHNVGGGSSPSASPMGGDEDEEVNSSVESSESDDMVLDQYPWETLPEDVRDDILTRVPFSARCRLRFVCRKWKEELISLPYRTVTMPPCMIWSRLGNGNPRFFCQAQQQWFSLPSTAFTIPSLSDLPYASGKRWNIPGPPWRPADIDHVTVQESVFTIPSDVNVSSKSKRVARWELVDVDAGLLCYRRNVEGSFWLCVSNPLTCYVRVIPPSYHHERFKSNPYMLKLLVDREEKTFKVILVLDKPMLTAMYESTTSTWVLCSVHPDIFGLHDLREYESPGIHTTEMFVWKNVVYAYSTVQDAIFGNLVMAFSVKFKCWIQIAADFPRENAAKTKHFFLSDGVRMCLVQFCSGRKSLISIWRLLDDGLSPLESDDGASNLVPSDLSTHAKFINWEKVFAGSSRSMARSQGVTLPSELGDVCYGTGYFYFMFRGKENKAKGSRIHTCLKFSLADRSWEVVPCPTSWKDPFKLYHWEPSLGADPSDEYSSESDEGTSE